MTVIIPLWISELWRLTTEVRDSDESSVVCQEFCVQRERGSGDDRIWNLQSEIATQANRCVSHVGRDVEDGHWRKELGDALLMVGVIAGYDSNSISVTIDTR